MDNTETLRARIKRENETFYTGDYHWFNGSVCTEAQMLLAKKIDEDILQERDDNG